MLRYNSIALRDIEKLVVDRVGRVFLLGTCANTVAVVVVAVAQATDGFLVVVALLVSKGEEIWKGWRDRPVVDVGVDLVIHDQFRIKRGVEELKLCLRDCDERRLGPEPVVPTDARSIIRVL